MHRPPSNFSWFNDYLAASSIPICEEEIYWLREAGIEVIVSLDLDFDDSVLDAIKKTGIEHVIIEIQELAAPSTNQMLKFVEVVKWAKERGKKVLVHCFAGCGRTGTMLAALLVYEGYAPMDAVREVRKVRPCSIESYEQLEAIKKFWNMLNRKRLRKKG